MKYKIKSGDTLSQIAKDNNISLKKLAELNNIKDVNKIFAGKTLDIPSREKPKTKKSSSVERVNQSDPFFIQEESGEFKSTRPKSTTKVTPAVQEKKIATDKNNEFYSGNLPLAVRQLADDTKYDIFRNFLPKETADKLSKKLFGEEENITKSDFSKEEFEVLRNIVKQNVLQNKFSVDYDDYRNFGAKGSSTIKDNPFELLNNPARSLQYTFGKGSINVDDKGDVYFTDQFNFNDAKMADNPQPYYGSAWDDEGFLKMDYDSGLRGLLSNQFKKVRNYKTRVGRGEGEGAATNLLIGNIKDFQNPINEIYASRKTGGITNYNKGGQMDIQQQTKNVAAQGRYGDSMLLHVNPAEVKGLASAMPITVNPQTGQPEAFLPFLAPIFGSMLGGSLLAGSTLGGLATAGLSKAAAAGIGAGLAQTAVTGDIKEGFKAGLTAGMGARIFGGGAEASKFAEGAQGATDAATKINTNVLLKDPTLAQAGQASSTLVGPVPPVLNPAGQMELANMMPDASNYIAQGGKDAVTAYSGNIAGPGAATFGEDFSTVFTDGVGQGLSNIGSAAINDPLALATLGTTGTMYGMDMMQADYEEQMARMQAEREEKRRQNMLMNPEPILYSAEGGRTGYFMGGDMRAAIDSVGGRNITGGELPQIFAPAKQAYAVNPDFMPGFAPETMYFNPATISAPASGLQAGAPPVGIDTYEGSKGGYGGRQASIAPQVSIDPYSAYTGQPPAGLEFTNTPVPMPIEPMPELPVQPVLPPDFRIGPIGGIPGLLSNINLYDPSYMSGVNERMIGKINERTFPMTGNDLGLPMGEGTPMPAGTMMQANDLGALLPPGTDNGIDISDYLGSREDTLSGAQAMFGPQVRFATGLEPNTDSGMGLGLGEMMTTEELIARGGTPQPRGSGLFGKGDISTIEEITPMPNFLNQPFIEPNVLMENQNYMFEPPIRDRKEGGETLKSIPEDNKGLPKLPKDVRNEMGYMQAGGMTEMQNDPLTREVTAFLLGESNNEEALNMFLTKYGNEAFMQLREAVLQSVVPGAQTEGLIRGDGQGGMDDDLMGMIGDKERIAVSQDEFIVPADVVSMLGDGSSDAGSKELYDMMDRVRKEKTGTTKQAPRLANAGGLLPA